MWWNVYNELSKRMVDQFSGMLTPPPSRPNKPRSKHLDAMIQQISADLAAMADDERELVKSQIARQAREWCLKDISHDLRTPLNAIIGFTQLMENGTFGAVSNPQYLEYLRHIRESGYELLEKVEGLMENVHPAEDDDMSDVEETASHQANDYQADLHYFKEAVAL